MSSSPASMAAYRMIRFGKSSFHRLFHSHHCSPTATSAAIQLIDNAAEPRTTHRFSVELPNPFTVQLHELRPYQNNLVPPIDVQYHAATFPSVDRSRVEVRGRPIKIDDDIKYEDPDSDDDDDDNDDDIDIEGLSDIEDFDDDAEVDETVRRRLRK
ncbi:unnamed protein product [Ilex paraguariensis]|uniref:Uncharacterized protein n=1 Tax=Ilex paraguariensis TaxID=185542 RepID=A0ABC8UPW4_9AQUA